MTRLINARIEHVALRVTSIILGLIAPLGCAAQVGPSNLPVRPSASQQLATFEQVGKTGKYYAPDALRHPENYSAATVDAVIAGLETVALSAKPNGLRRDAVIALSRGGSDKQRIPGLFDRIVKLYKRDNELVCVVTIKYIASGPEPDRGVELLKTIATGTAPPRCDFAPSLAAEELSHMGERGRAILSELYAKSAFADQGALDYVAWFLAQPPQ